MGLRIVQLPSSDGSPSNAPDHDSAPHLHLPKVDLVGSGPRSELPPLHLGWAPLQVVAGDPGRCAAAIVATPRSLEPRGHPPPSVLAIDHAILQV